MGGSCVPLPSAQPPFRGLLVGLVSLVWGWPSPAPTPITSVGLLGNSGANLDYGKFTVWGGDLGLLWPLDSRGAQACMRLGVLKLGSCPPPTPLQTPNREFLVVKESIEKAHVSVHRCPLACGCRVTPAPGPSLAVPAPTACLGMNFLPVVSQCVRQEMGVGWGGISVRVAEDPFILGDGGITGAHM